MNARDARRLLLVQAFEHTPDATWSVADAAWATAEARRIEGSSTEPTTLLARRAELASQRLVERQPALASWLHGYALPGWVFLLALAGTFAFGLALDGFDGQASINILALPLLGLLAWNLLVYALLAVQAVRSRSARSRDAKPLPYGLQDALARGVAWCSQRLADAPRDLPALSRFQLAWAQAARPLHTARAATALHALAAAVALGLIAGLYARGLAFEYRAGWESTFLGRGGAHSLVSALLGPAATLIGDPLPTADALAALNFAVGRGENAAPWIHRIALTVAMVVVLPRLVLAAWSKRQARRLSNTLPLDLRTPYFERLSRELSGQRVALHIQPYAHRLTPEREAACRRLLAAALGGEVQATFAEPLAYGAATPAETSPEKPAQTRAAAAQLVLFSASATPEAEVQGAFLRPLPAEVPVLIDETDLRMRLAGPDAATRLEQRRGAWRAMLDAQARTAVFVDLDAMLEGDPPAALADALFRTGSLR